MLLKSRAFWTAVLDAVISLLLLAIGLTNPTYLELVKQIILVIQPVILMLIAAFTVDDTVKLWASVKQQEIQARAMKE